MLDAGGIIRRAAVSPVEWRTDAKIRSGRTVRQPSDREKSAWQTLPVRVGDRWPYGVSAHLDHRRSPLRLCPGQASPRIASSPPRWPPQPSWPHAATTGRRRRPPRRPGAAAVTVWFADEAGALVAETRRRRARRRPGGRGPRARRRTLGAWAAHGPSAGTRVLGARGGRRGDGRPEPRVRGGVPAGGSAAELAVVGPLVKTAAEAAGAGRVRILVEAGCPRRTAVSSTCPSRSPPRTSRPRGDGGGPR